MLNATAVQIPCCLCGTLILPNAANKCGACLASQYDLTSLIQRGPGGGDIMVYQCRQCRRYQRSDRQSAPYQDMEPESPELLALCLKQIPALQATAEPKLHIVDAKWIWTEPNNMRFRVHLTVRYDIDHVPVQQRVMVELRNAWKQCQDCNRQYTNREWHAVVQVRQQRHHDTQANKRGLQALEMAIAKHASIRKHVLKIDAARNGFDFYFLTVPQAQAFGHYLQRINPMRIKTSQKLVSTDVKNNTANVKHTLTCDLVPLCREDLVLIHKAAKGAQLSGRLAIVDKVSSVISLLDASPQRNAQSFQMNLSADPYYKNEKHYQVLQTANRMTRFVVLDVELCEASAGGDDNDESSVLFQGKKTPGVSKHALADVLVARESDFGVNDETFNVVTHLGHLIQAGDMVLGYDLESTVGGDWELDSRSLQSNYVLPDVVLVSKVSSVVKDNNKMEPDNEEDEQQQPGQKRMTKKREKRRERKEGKKMRELEESAARMGFLGEENDNNNEVDDHQTNEFEEELLRDPELAAELKELETALEAAAPAEEDTEDLVVNDQEETGPTTDA